MPKEQRQGALQLIFSFFLGVLLVVFVGVGVYTFYPGPWESDTPDQERLDELRRDQEEYWGQGPEGEKLSAAEEAEMEAVRDEMDEIQDRIDEEASVWGRNTSIVLIVFATLLMGISLVLPDRMRVISNGVLLGGLFSVVYGTGWSFVGGDSIARFAVVSVAVILTLVFGYVRFVLPRMNDEDAVVEG